MLANTQVGGLFHEFVVVLVGFGVEDFDSYFGLKNFVGVVFFTVAVDAFVDFAKVTGTKEFSFFQVVGTAEKGVLH